MRPGVVLLAFGAALALTALWVAEACDSQQWPVQAIESPKAPAGGADGAVASPESAERTEVTEAATSEPRHRRIPAVFTRKTEMARREAAMAALMNIDGGVREPALPERSPKVTRHDALANALHLPASSPTRAWLASWLEENTTQQREVLTQLASRNAEDRARTVEEFNRATRERLQRLIAKLGVRGALEASRRIQIHILSPEGGITRVDALGEPIIEREVEEDY